jgi:ribose-phosphate pyrophosphokinase
MLFAGSSHQELAQAIADRLRVCLGKASIEAFPDGEIGVQVLESVRGKEIFLLQTIARRPNHYLMELLILVDAMKRASAKRVTAILPYFGYARQDRKEKGRVPITAKLVANLLEKAGVDRVLTLDLHAEQIQGFFDVPVDHLTARSLFVSQVEKKEPLVVVSPDVGSSRRARRFAEALGSELAIVDKRRLDGNQVELGALIGEVRGKQVLIVDDIVSTGATLKGAARICRENGAKRILGAVTHGLAPRGAKPADWGLDRLYVTNSVPQERCAGVEIVDCSPLLARAIECIVEDKSISSLF